MFLPSSPPNQFPYHRRRFDFSPLSLWYIARFEPRRWAQHSRMVRQTVTCICFLGHIKNSGIFIHNSLHYVSIYFMICFLKLRIAFCICNAHVRSLWYATFTLQFFVHIYSYKSLDTYVHCIFSRFMRENEKVSSKALQQQSTCKSLSILIE